jgi:hypothetical protein
VGREVAIPSLISYAIFEELAQHALEDKLIPDGDPANMPHTVLLHRRLDDVALPLVRGAVVARDGVVTDPDGQIHLGLRYRFELRRCLDLNTGARKLLTTSSVWLQSAPEM